MDRRRCLEVALGVTLALLLLHPYLAGSIDLSRSMMLCSLSHASFDILHLLLAQERQRQKAAGATESAHASSIDVLDLVLLAQEQKEAGEAEAIRRVGSTHEVAFASRPTYLDLEGRDYLDLEGFQDETQVLLGLHQQAMCDECHS